MRSGLLVVDRDAFVRLCLQNKLLPQRAPFGSHRTEESLRAYGGFDAIAWPQQETLCAPIAEGLVSFDLRAAVEQYFEGLEHQGGCELLALAMPGERIEVSGFDLLGFDLGRFASETSHFSTLLNEVAFGAQPELRAFIDDLNPHLLSDSVSLCERILGVRTRLVAEGHDLEALPYEHIVAIFRHLHTS